MNTEITVDLERRAAMHAALADPARLAITDTLADGDASPSELAAMPSNLLAHHLRVLEDAGVVARHRSEGDRRRTYLRLVPGSLDGLAGPPGRAARRVLFVCTANSARSHLAAALWRQASRVPAASAGTRPAAGIAPGAIAAAARRRLPLPRHHFAFVPRRPAREAGVPGPYRQGFPGLTAGRVGPRRAGREPPLAAACRSPDGPTRRSRSALSAEPG